VSIEHSKQHFSDLSLESLEVQVSSARTDTRTSVLSGKDFLEGVFIQLIRSETPGVVDSKRLENREKDPETMAYEIEVLLDSAGERVL
jgi:hypothetical protein